MANNNGGKSQSTFETYATVFGDKKAYTFGMSNGKYRIAVASCIPNNGNPQWDFRNTTGVSIDAEDLNRILSACKSLIHIYIAVHKDPNIVNVNPIYSTKMISIPLVAKSTGNPYGEFSVGFKSMEGNGEETFFFQFQTTSTQDGSITKDYFYFRKSEGQEGKIVFRNESGIEMKSTEHKQLMFANFVRMVEAALNFGRIGFGIHTALRYSGGNNSGGYRNNGNNWNNGNGGNGYGNNGGNDSGNDDYPSDIPF